jgi:hypothetical protein
LKVCVTIYNDERLAYESRCDVETEHDGMDI